MASNALYEQLRSLIFDVAAANEAIGPLEESLKWGQPSFAPKKKNVGSSVRLSQQDDGDVAMYFICTTKLVSRFEEIYPGLFDYRDGRSLMFKVGQGFDAEALGHCVGMALTYKLKR